MKNNKMQETEDGIIKGAKIGAGGRIYGAFKTAYKKVILTLFTLAAMTTPISASTGGAGAADAKWEQVIGFITPWISRVGGLIIVFGVVELAISFKDDNADGKTKGIRFVVAGLIVFAVGLSTDLFLK